ncbi:MAG: wax ester/triacylglycerol synthase domain-containing protein [Terracoccus sp.]
MMELATDTPSAPQHVAAILRLERAVDPTTVREVLSDRLPGVPRLRQRLIRAPLGGGRPLWVDDTTFDIAHHLTVRTAPAPGDEAALLDVSSAAATTRLPRNRPLWSVTVVTGLENGSTALVLVLHHVLADGIGGLAALASLVDGAPPAPPRAFPAPAPIPTALWIDATRRRIRALASLPRVPRLLREAATELQLGTRGRPSACSLNQPIGPRRRLAVTSVPLTEIVGLAHHHQATVNDVLLTAVAGALTAALHDRGESVDSFVISIPISVRRDASSTELGNQVGVMPVQVPAAGRPFERLAAIAASTHAACHSPGRGASAPLLAFGFRLLARVGVFAFFVNHQRLVTTFVTNLRGPSTPMTLDGARVTEIIPISSISGNITVAFAALSYAGTLTVTIIADPDHCPDLLRIATALDDELDHLASTLGAAGPNDPERWGLVDGQAGAPKSSQS